MAQSINYNQHYIQYSRERRLSGPVARGLVVANQDRAPASHSAGAAEFRTSTPHDLSEVARLERPVSTWILPAEVSTRNGTNEQELKRQWHMIT